MEYQRTKLCQELEEDFVHWEEKASKTTELKNDLLESIDRIEKENKDAIDLMSSNKLISDIT